MEPIPQSTEEEPRQVDGRGKSYGTRKRWFRPGRDPRRHIRRKVDRPNPMRIWRRMLSHVRQNDLQGFNAGLAELKEIVGYPPVKMTRVYCKGCAQVIKVPASVLACFDLRHTCS